MHRVYRQTSLATLAAIAVTFLSGIVSAMDVRFTGFGTVGYARSFEHDVTYLRYIDHNGTFKTDSIAGVQAEAQFNAQWGATVQAVASAPRTRDDGYEAKVRWAFLSFRPDNDWLLRVGRVRPPVFFNTQNAEVGATYDQVRLPAEVYSLSPVYDVDGAALTKVWSLEDAEFNVDAYWGKSNVKYRIHSQHSEPRPYFSERITFKGLVFSHLAGTLALRAGVHEAKVESKEAEQFPTTLSPITIPAPPPFGGTLYAPPAFIPSFKADVLTLGIDWRPDPWRVTAEYARRKITETSVGPNDEGAYVTVSRQIDKWNPYVTYARLLSTSSSRELYKAVSSTPVPLAVQGPPQFIPASFHGSLADGMQVYDQHSIMLGTSYSFTPTSKLKLEWMRTELGLTSSLADGSSSGRSLNVVSMSYSLVF